MNGTALKDRNRQGCAHVAYWLCRGGMRPSQTIICAKGKRREIAGYRCLPGEFRCVQVGHGGLVIRTRSVSAFQSLINGDDFERLVRRLVGEFKFLTGSQADDTRHRQLLDSEVVLRLDQLLLSGLEFALGT